MKTLTKLIATNTHATVDIDQPIDFVVSNSEVDRVGDRVMPSWNLDHFKANPICLFGHSHSHIVGTWVDIKLVGTVLEGTLKLAKAGTSALVDEVRSLVEQGILKAVSIGFQSLEAKENSFGGYDLKNNLLMEISLVAVPALQSALRKSLSKHLSSDELDSICSVSGCNRSKSPEDTTSVTANPQTHKTIKKIKGITMTYAERIKALQTSMQAKQALLGELNAKANLSDEDMATMEQLNDELASEGARLKQFEAMEKSSANVPATVVKAVVVPERVSKEDAKDAVIKSIVALSKSAIDGTAVSEVVKSVYGNSKEVATFVKAATNPATMGDNVWAGNLIQDGYGSYLEDLMADTIFGAVPAQSVTFGKMGSISLPFRSGTGSLSGAFIEEGEPIPVKADAYNTVKISPFKLGVISVFSKELFRKSIPNIETLVRSHIQTDTADVIDSTFLDANPATTTRPAGLEASAGAANIVASTGVAVDSILADFNGVFERLTTAKLGGGGVVLIHPSRLRGMNMKTDALGNFVFRGENILTGFNFVGSVNVPSDKVYVIDNKALIKGIGYGVEFETNSSATIVMGDPAEPINDGIAATALPVRSLYQTDSTAIRMTMDISWLQVRADSVQILTGVAW